jgi:hypothetical protein
MGKKPEVRVSGIRYFQFQSEGCFYIVIMFNFLIISNQLVRLFFPFCLSHELISN